MRQSLLRAILVGGCALLSCGESAHDGADEDRALRDGGLAPESAARPPPSTSEGSTPLPPSTVSVPPGAPLPQSGRAAPPLALDDVETGKRWELATAIDPTGQSCPRAVMLAFMASWCAYCAQSLPTLVELEQNNPELAVVTVTVDSSPETQRQELDKVRKAGLTGPVLSADAATIATWTGSDRSVPKYYFVNQNGVLVAKDDGFGDKVKPMMAGQAFRALGGRTSGAE